MSTIKFVNNNIINGNFDYWSQQTESFLLWDAGLYWDSGLYWDLDESESNYPAFWYALGDPWRKIDTNVASGSYCLGVYASGSTSKYAWTAPFIIENPPTNSYDFHMVYRFGGNVGRFIIYCQQMDKDMAIIVSTTLLDTSGNYPEHWTILTKTITKIGDGGDVELNANTIYVRFQITFMMTVGNEGHGYIDAVRLEDNTICEFSIGSLLPYNQRIVPLQTSSETLGGAMPCDDKNKDITIFEFSFEGLSQSDKNKLLTFLEHSDIDWHRNSFRFRDYDNIWYDVWYVEDSLILTEMPDGVFSGGFNLKLY